MTSSLDLSPRLGCATDYAAVIYYWDRRYRELSYYTTLTGLLEITWERVLDDYSEARVRFRPNSGDDCCGKLKPIYDSAGNMIQPGVWVWAHELALYRDGELVWQGPIFSIDELVLPDESTDHIQIVARDFLGWLDRRTIHDDLYLNGSGQTYDLSYIAERIIRSGLKHDDLGLLEYLTIIPSNRKRKWSVRHWEARAGEELRELARLGLDFTCVGRRIVVKGPKYEGEATPVLRTRDFLSGVEIRMVGAEAATAGIAVGATPDPDPDDPDPPPIEDVPPFKRYWPKEGPEAAVDPFFGLIENWTRSESVKDVGYLDWIASQRVAEGYPPPHTLSVPAGSGLSPEAPVSIHQLVPGMYFTILVQGMCRSLAQHMRLSQVRTTWREQRPEEVGVAFIPANVLDDNPDEEEGSLA